MQIPSKYDASQVESKWYDYWMKHNYFHSIPDEREPYTVVIPPPNVTGVLHMGHMLNNTIQDVLVRRARLLGKNACWVPGTDHASIATEAKVVDKLKSDGVNKADISREEFIEHAWEWTHKHGGIILEQLKKLGASCDWERTKFTLDDDLSESVIDVFIDLYKKGLIYRGYRMVNWDPVAKTTLSDEEVIHVERTDKLYYVNYKVEGEENYVTIATTRPETILGDTAVCVNPSDERFKSLKGKRVVVPICNRVVPIIMDDYVDIEFGTGCLKITPAHDVNDKDIGERHKLEVIDILNDDGSLNSYGLHFQGLDREVARKQVAKELDTLGILVKTEDYTHKVGTSERTKAVIEPKISAQWFLKMKDLAKPALDHVMNDDIQFHPAKFKNSYRNWMENVRDWNISRQLYWGHQIPAYYYGDGVNDFVVAKTNEEALELAKQTTNNQKLTTKDLTQESDVVDTWFSSWLWPMSVFDGIRNPDNKEINYYYPTNDLVTAPEIMFFWVARMIIAGYEYRDELPFKNVYYTGIVRDKQGRKMSKSLGNSPDPIELIEKYGADGVRVGMLMCSPAGNDLPFDESLCGQGKAFANKIWNAFRLINGWEDDDSIPQPNSSKIALEWYEAKFQQTLLTIEDHFSKFRLSDALMETYKLIWNDFASWLLEIVKPAYQQPIDAKTLQSVIAILENNLKILHPFMPFLTEEIWQYISERTSEEALIVSQWPETKTVNESLISEFEFAQDVVSGIRSIRKQKNIAFKDTIGFSVINNENVNATFDEVIVKLGNLESINYVTEAVDGALTFRVKSNEYFIPMSGAIDIEAEIKKLTEELNYTEGFLKSVQKKLSNERFVNNAPEQVVATEKKKESEALAKIETLKTSLASLGS
ncbi:valine--tRNA ligase [Yeosuana sp. MJ-SS3]|uniref:Valine--tRNA ligase n=1 Tax=Gilvirhabdus luticola TaxID=3079858 RepID=A0ABU3U4G5_9FLAO|nr:valine--tRNA ligase [Yeosuana sp. MJ-SS3]MDU8885309.1 valine--tRNA ligase [Yeosuana sp. MJ-SS3]